MNATDTFGAHLKDGVQMCFAAYGDDFFTCRFRVGRVCRRRIKRNPSSASTVSRRSGAPYPMEEQE